MNAIGVATIFSAEMNRWRRTFFQSVLAPVISTSLYFVVFGTVIGNRIETVEGVSFGAFIVPGLMMMMLLMQSISNAAIGIYFPKFTGTVYEFLSAPISSFEIVLGFVGAAESKEALIAHRPEVPFITVRGRRGGSAIAAAALNALAGGSER